MQGPATTVRIPKIRKLEDFSDELPRKKKRTRVVKQKRERHLIVSSYHAIKRWLMGERAEMDEIDVMAAVQEEAQKEILITRLKKSLNPKDSDLGFWKKGQEHDSCGINYTIYTCPMLYRAGCKCQCKL